MKISSELAARAVGIRLRAPFPLTATRGFDESSGGVGPDAPSV